MKRICLTLVTLLIGVMGLNAAITFTVKAPQTASVGEKFQVIYVLSGANASEHDIKAPRINGCTLLYGPSKLTKSSYSNINGRQSSSTSVEFTYIYKAVSEGTFTVPAATIVAEGKRFATNAQKLKVVAAGAAAPGRGRVQLDDPSSKPTGAPINANDIFVRINLSKSSAYEYEAIECSIKLYTKYGIQEFIPTQQPSFDGFLVEDLPLQSRLNQIEEVGGNRYFTAELKRCILFPQKTGKLTIRSGTYDLAVEQYDKINMSVFSAMTPTYRKIQLSSNSASADIKPLPSPKPAGFLGAVGDFTVDAKLSSSTFRTNEPASLVYTVAGSGNIRYITDPTIDFPAEFEQFSPEHKVDASMQGNNVKGTSVTTFTFVPQEPGEYTIDVPEFVYFNPATAQYVTLPSKQFTVKVARGAGTGSVEQRDIAAKNTDILYIKPSLGNLSATHSFIIVSVWFWLLMFGCPITAGIGYRIYKRRRARGADTINRIGKEAQKSLKMAYQCMKEGRRDDFYEEVGKALTGYTASRLKIPIAEFSRDRILSRMAEVNAPAELSDRLIAMLDECEMARFAPETKTADLSKVYDKAAWIIGRLSKIKINK